MYVCTPFLHVPATQVHVYRLAGAHAVTTHVPHNPVLAQEAALHRSMYDSISTLGIASMTVWSALICCMPSVLPPLSQILTLAIIAMAGLMCVVKGYVDTNILPYVTSHKEKKQKKDKKPADGGQKKKGSWELLTSSPRILNLTLMVGGRRNWVVLSCVTM